MALSIIRKSVSIYFYAASKGLRFISSSTINDDEIRHFESLASQMWLEDGEYEALHRMNNLRVPLVRDSIVDKIVSNKPLNGKRILDIGCGGGLLSEPLARLGAFVIGVDATKENIQIAQTHMVKDPLLQGNIKYIHGTANDLVLTESETFDAVVASEVIEHVDDLSSFISDCCKLAKPEGSVVITTINKTTLSDVFGIKVAENILGIVPPGTHDWNKFVSPDNLQKMLIENNCVPNLIHGLCYNPITRRWTFIKDTGINYAIVATRKSLN